MTTRALGAVREVLESAGLELSYVYEDLVFLEHNAFLLQFTDRSREVLIHTNEEARENELVPILTLLQKKAEENKMLFNRAGDYRLSRADEENITIEFLRTEKPEFQGEQNG